MSDPNLIVQKALFSALNSSSITLNGAPVPLYAYAPSGAAAPYILIDQIVTLPVAGAVACAYWECFFQFTIITSFAIDGVASDGPSLEISGQILSALEGQVLDLDQGFQMNPLTVVRTRKYAKSDSHSLKVLRYIEVKVKAFRNKQID
ncbi:DUF3168 domain-containing protein [Hymenobacter canadensis]|uniref:DUF3168 domain-containing protein n=1 Tax=Hymenobacter canadensis TaxID=2999067 RepID=A0ABY7LTA4_9BACT|nr:DUF3168 domain-containing protein [Hymenobacter canadensis]WBA43167.1 DUF3168 domain-containing protein [Hymenobacter canadensis]